MSFQRSQVIVMLRTTMSTRLSFSAGIRSAAEMTMVSYLLASPKIALATAFAMSMSKPSICPVRGLRDESRSESAETPTRRRPFFRISASALSAAAPVSAGSGCRTALRCRRSSGQP